MFTQEKHMEVLKELNDICTRKNADYGDSATDTFKKFGLLAYIIRLNDKLRRLESLVLHKKSRQVKDESVEDTLLDIANYCVLAVMDLRSEKNEL
jgi:hypothetical protein